MRRVRKHSAEGEPGRPEAADEHRAAIQRLERMIAAEREHSATLLQTIRELRFKLDILERSYSKQLEDARRRSETLEGELTEERARSAELDNVGEQGLQSLVRVKAELDRVTRERNLLRGVARGLAARSNRRDRRQCVRRGHDQFAHGRREMDARAKAPER